MTDELQFVLRRSFVDGHLVGSIESVPIRSDKYNRPVQRYLLTAAQAKFPIDALSELAAADRLPKWEAPPPLAKTIKERNSELAKTANAKASA